MDELSEWVRERYPSVYRTARLIVHNDATAQESTQEAFLRVWRFRDAIPAPPARDAWLYRVVVNACLSRLRTQASRPETLAGIEFGVPQRADAFGPDAAAEASALTAAVLRALAQLPESLRVPVVLRYYSGLSEREIALAIRRRPGTVKSRLSEARRRLATVPELTEWVSVQTVDDARSAP